MYGEDEYLILPLYFDCTGKKCSRLVWLVWGGSRSTPGDSSVGPDRLDVLLTLGWLLF